MFKTIFVPFQPLPGEEVLLMTRPHPLALLDLMLFWLSLAVLGALYIIYYPQLSAMLKEKVQIEFIVKHTYDVVWFVSIMLPLIIIAIFRINFGYVLMLLALAVGNVLLQWKVAPHLGLAQSAHAHLENYMLIAVGLFGVAAVEIFRRGHRYYLTSQRIVARFGILKVMERSAIYSKIDDLILQKGLLGGILNFGTVIPVTSSGLGMGQDLALGGAAVGGGKGGIGVGLFAAGGKAKNVPRALSIYVLFKIKKPEDARNIILQEMQARERPRHA